MNTTNLLKIALRALANNKLRGFLTMLGIIIGVASVITMLAIGQGSKRSIQAQISEMGSNMIMIQPGADMRGGVRQDASAMETLKLQDYEDIVNETRYVSATSPSVNSSGQVIYGANNAPTTVYGISPDYMEIRRYEVEDGDMFSDQDVQTAAKVCVIGKTVVDNLFPGGENPVGKVIRFQKLPFRVVGVLKSKGYNSMGMDDALLGESDLGSGDPGDLEAVVSVSLRFGLWLYVPLQAGATTELENGGVYEPSLRFPVQSDVWRTGISGEKHLLF